MKKQNKKQHFTVVKSCEVWAVSYMSTAGQFNTWGIYGSESKAKQEEAELIEARKTTRPVKTHVTPFIIDIKSAGGLLDPLVCDD